MDINKQRRFLLKWTAGAAEEGILLREFLQQQHISKAALADIKFHGGAIAVNDKEVTVRHVLCQGDGISVTFPPEKISEGLKPENIPLEIVFEDGYLLVVNKPPFMNTIPSREHPLGSLANAVAGYYVAQGIASTIHVVTRLDRDTSGLVLIAKHRHIHHLLSEAQKKGNVSRKYEAIAEGIIGQESGRIDAPIGRKDTSIIEREVRPDGQYACTLYEVLGRYERYSHISLQLLTGRTHQIRVHMASIGFPLAGDTLYGGDMGEINRQALHCRYLTFKHPLRGDLLSFESEMPADFKLLLEKA